MEKKFMFIRREQNLDDRREIDEFRVITLDKTIVNDYQFFKECFNVSNLICKENIRIIFADIPKKRYFYLSIRFLDLTQQIIFANFCLRFIVSAISFC